jgi:hypothetical protein
VLDVKEVVLRRKRSVDLADIEHAEHRWVALFGLNVAGMSVKGTSTSPLRERGSGPIGHECQQASGCQPRFKVSLRVVCCGVVSSGMALLGRDAIAGFSYILSLVL